MQLQAVGRARDRPLRAARRARGARVARGARRAARERSRQRVERARRAPSASSVERKLAPPVRLLVDGARQVRLLAHAEHVLELHDHDARRRAREIGVHGARELRRHRPASRRHRRSRPAAAAARARARCEQPRAILRALDDAAARASLRSESRPSARAHVEVVAVPAARERRQVVRRRGDQRVARDSASGGLKSPSRVALEVEQAVRQHAARRRAPSRTSSGTVPRSSPITMQRLRMALEREDRRAGRRAGSARRRRRAALPPGGIQYSRVRPITWSMRSAPAWRMLARSVAMNGA